MVIASTLDVWPPSGTYPGLPGRTYHAQDIFELEKERIFYDQWFCLGREDALAEPGNRLTRRVLDETIILIRTKAGEVAAFYNVCRHRGTELTDEGPGHERGVIKCPYHAWSYTFDGALVGTPNVAQADGFDRDRFGLWPVHVQTWEGFVFVNLGETPEPLHDLLESEPDAPLDYDRYRLSEMRIARTNTYDVAANWKIIVENFNECLHCPSIHPELVNIVPIYRKGMVVDPERAEGGVYLKEGATAFTMSGTSDLPALPGLSDVDRCTYYGYSVFPNLMVNLTSVGAMTFTLFPRSAGITTVVSDYLFRPETMYAQGFDAGDIVAFGDLVSRQDWDVCERAQRGVRSRAFTEGVNPPADIFVHVFGERYLERLGPF